MALDRYLKSTGTGAVVGGVANPIVGISRNERPSTIAGRAGRGLAVGAGGGFGAQAGTDVDNYLLGAGYDPSLLRRFALQLGGLATGAWGGGKVLDMFTGKTSSVIARHVGEKKAFTPSGWVGMLLNAARGEDPIRGAVTGIGTDAGIGTGAALGAILAKHVAGAVPGALGGGVLAYNLFKDKRGKNKPAEVNKTSSVIARDVGKTSAASLLDFKPELLSSDYKGFEAGPTLQPAKGTAKARPRMSSLLRKLRLLVRKHPVMSGLGALTAGVGAGALLGQKTSSVIAREVGKPQGTLARYVGKR